MARRILVIGAGVIGLSTAYYLSRRGERVSVIDMNEPGQGSSFGNLGWICPTLSEPLPAPGLVTKLLKWSLHVDSPVYLSPLAAFGMAGWLMQFWGHCNARDYEAGFDAMATLNQRSWGLYDELAADGLNFEMHKQGMIFAFLKESTVPGFMADFDFAARYGYPQARRLSRTEVRDLEPALSPEIAAGVLLPEERHVRPDTVTAALAEGARRHGAEIRTGAEVTGFERQGTRVTAALIGTERIEADQVVVTSGAWFARLGAAAGVRLPVQAGKGYSVTMTNPSVKVNRPLYLGELKVGFSPYRDALRIGGTMELSGINSRLEPRRVASIRRAAARYMTSPHGETEQEWVGMRPVTPDGLPVIGLCPGFENLYVATGHGSMGMTFGPVTGTIMADLLCTGKTAADLKPFDPARFIRR